MYHNGNNVLRQQHSNPRPSNQANPLKPWLTQDNNGVVLGSKTRTAMDSYSRNEDCGNATTFQSFMLPSMNTKSMLPSEPIFMNRDN